MTNLWNIKNGISWLIPTGLRGCVDTTSHLWFVLFLVPLVILNGPTKICKTYLVNATFPCQVTGYPPPKVTWYKNAKEITKMNNYNAVRKGDNLIITSVWGKNEGIYQCIASNGLETIHQAASLIVGGW